MLKFKPNDFDHIPHYPGIPEKLAEAAQKRFDYWLKENGKVVYGVKSASGFWVFSEDKTKNIDTHKAILINIEPLERCSHPKEKIKHVTKKMQSGEGTLTSGYMIDLTAYVCECGARVEPKEFEAIE